MPRVLSTAALALALVAAPIRADDSTEPPCLEIDMSTMESALAAPCADPALACSNDDGCVGAMVNWLSPQFENRTIDADAYANVTPKWMVECTAPHITTYLRAIPMETFMNLQSCDYSGYVERWPELRAFDFSSITASDFLEHMPPGMMMDILRATREQRAAAAAATD